MSSTRRSRNNMEKGVLGLNEDEIQEELLNADLKALGINEDDLCNMATQEKKNLLAAIKQSTSSEQLHESSSFQNKQASFTNSEEPLSAGSSPNPVQTEKNDIEISIDSPEEYPSLPSPGNVSSIKRNNQQRQQQPKKSDQTISVVSVNSNHYDSGDDNDDDSSDEYVSEDNQLFSIPGFVDDSGSDLKQCVRKTPEMRNVHYYTLPGQSSKDAVRSMLKNYNSWYKVWCSVDHNDESDDVSPSTTSSSADIIPLSRGNSCYLLKTGNEIINSNDRTQFNKSSSPDIEEVEITEIKPPDESRLTLGAKAKTLPRETNVQNVQSPSSSSSPSIAVNFDEKWDPESGTWTNSRRGKSRINNRLTNERETSSKPEPKVQCPICQLDFVQSKVESHAAVCEGFPSETRSNLPSTSYSSRLEESNHEDDCDRNNLVELTELSTVSSKNKKRGN